MLTSKVVEELMMDCLSGESYPDAVIVDGIVRKFAFAREKLEENRSAIIELLKELPEPFHQGTGDGWSFLNACMDKDNNQWTGSHQTMEELFCLGMGLGIVEYVLPRDMWSLMPGGMPYIVVKV